MSTFAIIVGILLFIGLAFFSLYAILAVRHATHFRYLSKRMLFLTLCFASSSLILSVGLVVAYIFLVLSE